MIVKIDTCLQLVGDGLMKRGDQHAADFDADHDRGVSGEDTVMLGTAAAIIGGGAATRFGGRDKSRLVISGISIINRQAAALQPLVHEIFIVASQQERFAGTPWRVVPDAFPGTGVTGAIATALGATAADRVLTVACDLPFLPEGLLRRLIELAGAPGADAAWVRTESGPEPLVACYRVAAAPAIRAAIARGELRAGALAGRLTIREIETDELRTFGDPARILANINSPDDLSTIERS
jgi:molybdopterin-guanine dinucleotide biosynthesis protein A